MTKTRRIFGVTHRHPLQLWIDRAPGFQYRRDSRRVFGVTYAFLFRVFRGLAHPSPERARAWERVTGIPAAKLVHPRWKELLRHGRRAQSRTSQP